jgi:peptidoglycan-N-acetylmuramic acid deacetylase
VSALLLILTNVFLTPALAASGGVNWYVKRSGNIRPVASGELLIIEKYNGYYIDKKVSDTSENKVLYLTFDAGYENGNVEKILNTLKEKNVPAAFFLLDHIILKNTELVRRMNDEGHFVCNHTKNHKDLSTLSREEIIDNITDLERIYEQKCNAPMKKYFRFPEGRYSEDALAVINELGYKTIFWSFGYADWDDKNQPPAEASFKKILSNTHNGAVILLHPTSATNAEILPLLIDEWRNMGYTFGNLDELTS